MQVAEEVVKKTCAMACFLKGVRARERQAASRRA